MCKTFLTYSVITSLLVLQGCTFATDSAQHDNVVGKVDYIPLSPTSEATSFQSEVLSNRNRESPVITFLDALRITKERSPQIKSYEATLKSKEGLIQQAKVLNTNPEIIVQPENFGGNLSGVSRSETAILLGKTLELGGKRNSRVALAKAEQELQRIQNDIAMADLFVQLRKAFVRLQAAQKLRNLSDSQLKIAQEQVKAIEKRVAFGGIRTSEISKARVIEESSKLDVRKAENEIIIAHKQLTAFWGGSENDLGNITELEEPSNSSVDLSKVSIEKSLTFSQSVLEAAIKKSKVDFEEANGYPDVRASIGMRHLQDTHEDTFIGELAVPLPIFDTNSGAIDSAKAEASAAINQVDQKKIELASKLDDLQQNLVSLLEEYKALKNSILKESVKSLEELKRAYDLGKASYYELLDGERTFFETQKRCIETQVKIEETKLDLNNLLLDHPVDFNGNISQ